MKEVMEVRVELEYDPATKSWSAVCPELPGCTSAGETKEEAIANVKEAVSLYLEPTVAATPGAEQVTIKV